MKIADISIRRPSVVIVVFTALTLFGLISFFSLNYELLPKFSPSVISVSTIYPGASPSEVENTVTKKIEDAVASLESIKKLEATSFESVSLVVIQLKEGADVDFAINEAQRKVNTILSDLPDDVKAPALNKFSFDDLPILRLSATSNMDESAFYDIVDKQIQPVLSRVEGVAQVNIIGGQEREIQVSVDAKKLESYNLSILQVQQMILTSNLDFPTGSVRSDDMSILVRLAGKFENIDELRNLVIFESPAGGQIRLKDIADVQDAQKDVDKFARVNQKSALALEILKQSDANAVEVSKQTKKIISQIENQYKGEGIHIDVASDSSEYTLKSANAVVFDLILAIVLVALIMLFFLHSLRNSVIVMIAIPVSLVATFIGMELVGFSLNMMSLLGLSLVVGILVDDAIVVIENIYRHMEMGKNRVRAAFDGTREIGFTVLSITLVIVVVFLPISLSSSMVAKILKEFSMVVVISVLLSLLASFTIVPLMVSRMGKVEKLSRTSFIGKFVFWFEDQLARFTRWITGILEWTLRHKFITIGLVTLMFIGSFLLVAGGYIIGEFLPQGDRSEFFVQIELPKDASIEETNRTTKKAEAYLMKQPEVVSVITTVGQSSDGVISLLSPTNKAELTVKIVDKNKRNVGVDIFGAKVQQELQQRLVEAKVVTKPMSFLGVSMQAPVQLVVIGSDLDSVAAFSKVAMSQLKTIPGVTDPKISYEDGNPEIKVKVDRDKMSALGLNLGTVGATMSTAFNGNTNGKFRQGQYEYDINIRLDDFNRQSIEDVRNISFLNGKGEMIHLNQFASIEESFGPSQLTRRDKSTAIKIESQNVGKRPSEIVAEWQKMLDKTPLPTGVSYVWGGDTEMQTEGFGDLGIALLASVFLVYFIMVLLYDSFVYPLVILVSIPLAVIGALLALALTNNTLNIFTILGLIMLIGLVAKNAIILVDFINHLKAEGRSTHDALIEANHVRLRPILMTTIAMVFGMLPIAMSNAAGSESKSGMAWVIIGGLISSLFLTLVIVPVVYQIFENILDRLGLNKPKLPIDEMISEPYHLPSEE